MNTKWNKPFVLPHLEKALTMTNLTQFEMIRGYLPKLNPVSQSVVIASLSHLIDLNAEEQFEWLHNIIEGFSFLEDDAFDGAQPLTDEQEEILKGLQSSLKNKNRLNPSNWNGKITPVPL